MPDINNDFQHIHAMDVPQLHARYQELTASLATLPDGRPNPAAIDDDAKLHEMCVILTALRRKSSGPPKKASSKAKLPPSPVSIDML